jgi:uncharacterized membrane protein (UPF0182 family)
MRPYYQLIKVPGARTEEFQLVIPFVPAGRPNMVGWMAASSDPINYGHITMFRFPEGQNIEGPPQVFSRINNDPAFSSFRTLVGQQGSTLSFGDFLVIPIDDSFLYVLPVYVQASEGSSPIPELKRVIVVNGSNGDVSLGTSLPDALGLATNGVSGGQNPGGPSQPPTGNTDQQIQDLLTQALSHFQKADAALKAGDLATYQSELTQAQALVQQAQQLALAAQGSGSGGSPSISPTSGPTVSTPPPTVTPSPSASP